MTAVPVVLRVAGAIDESQMPLVQLEGERRRSDNKSRIVELRAGFELAFVVIPVHELQAQLVEDVWTRQIAVFYLRDVDQILLVDPALARYGSAEVGFAAHFSNRPFGIDRTLRALLEGDPAKSRMVQVRSFPRPAIGVPDRRIERRAARYDVDEIVGVRHLVIDCKEQPVLL